MSKKQTYLFLFAIGLILVYAGQFIHITYISRLTTNTWHWMQSPYIFVPAALCAFIFINNKKYWMINTGIALIISLIIQFFILNGGASIYTILVRAFAFLVIVYLLNLIKVILDK